MKYQRVLLLMLLAASVPAAQVFGSELDDELNSLQVQVRQEQVKKVTPQKRKQIVKKTYAQPAKQILVASAATTPTYANPGYNNQPVVAPAPVRPAPTTHYGDNGDQLMADGSTYSQPKQDGFIYKLNLVPMGSLTTLDGSDRGTLIPQNSYNTPSGYSFNFGGALTADVNLFNSTRYVVEIGGALIQTGSTLGASTVYGYSYNDQVRLTYIGVPVGVKWLAKGEHESTPFVKLGAIPMIEINHAYSVTNSGTYSIATASNEYRFGGYTQYDVMVDLAVGYSYKINESFSALIAIEGFQGLVPVFQTYNALNLGGNLGLGISYAL